MTIWKYTEVDHSQAATQKLAKLFDGKKYFDYPKPVELLKRCLSLYTSSEDCIVMDFFSGSGTFAQAVMELNAVDNGKRRYILVQASERMGNPANVSLKFETIPQFAIERIRRAGKKVKEEAGEQAKDLDIGFRVLKLDSSNMEDVYYTPDEFDAHNLFTSVDNVKPDRTPLDLLFQVMPELNIELSAKIEERDINGKKVFVVDDGYLIATFDKEVNESTITEIAKLRPVHFAMRDASAATDNVLDNFEQIFNHYSPDTTCRII